MQILGHIAKIYPNKKILLQKLIPLKQFKLTFLPFENFTCTSIFSTQCSLNLLLTKVIIEIHVTNYFKRMIILQSSTCWKHSFNSSTGIVSCVRQMSFVGSSFIIAQEFLIYPYLLPINIWEIVYPVFNTSFSARLWWICKPNFQHFANFVSFPVA